MQQELSKQTNNFLTELQAVLLESDESKQNDAGKSVRGGDIITEGLELTFL